MKMSSMLVGPNNSPHYISKTLAPIQFKCDYICHNFSGFTVRSGYHFPAEFTYACQFFAASMSTKNKMAMISENSRLQNGQCRWFMQRMQLCTCIVSLNENASIHDIDYVMLLNPTAIWLSSHMPAIKMAHSLQNPSKRDIQTITIFRRHWGKCIDDIVPPHLLENERAKLRAAVLVSTLIKFCDVNMFVNDNCNALATGKWYRISPDWMRADKLTELSRTKLVIIMITLCYVNTLQLSHIRLASTLQHRKQYNWFHSTFVRSCFCQRIHSSEFT